MAYEVIARKWRPQQFEDVIGQEHVTDTLRNAIRSERVAHAYLFVGPRGTGKTTTARILAKALNCFQGPTETPCDDCDACREIMAGRNLDVLEIDGASNNGVDQVRDLRNNVQYAPSRGPLKIYIIDEVHMLSQAAFNALLKTLEEPPAHVKFMFATTEPQKVPATILSRCQRFDLRRIPVRAIVARLNHVAEAEALEVEPEAMLAIARGADGGMRDAQSALDQLVSFRGESVREEDVLSVFGLVSWQVLEALASAIIRGDVAEAIRAVARMDRGGKDLRRLTVELLEHFRNLLVCTYVEDAAELTDLAEAQLETLRALAAESEPEPLLRVVEILTDTESRMRYALSPRTLLETGLIKAARAATVVSIEELIRQVEALRDGSPPPAAAADAPAPVKAASPAPDVAPVPAPKPAMGDLSSLRSEWSGLVDEAGRYAKLALGFLKGTMPLRLEEDRLVLGYEDSRRSQLEQIDGERARKAVAKVAGGHLGRSVQVTFEVCDDLPAPPPNSDGAGEETPPGNDGPPPEPRAEGGGSHRTRADWTAHPAVQKTLEKFNGDIVDVRD